MRIAFVATLAAAVQAVRVETIEELPSPINFAAIEAETEAALQADVDAKLEAYVESVCESYVAANAGAGMDVNTLKTKVVEALKNFKKDANITPGSIMTAIGEVAKTVKAVGGVLAGPDPVTIGIAAKQLWDDYQNAKGFFKNWQANRNKRLGK